MIHPIGQIQSKVAYAVSTLAPFQRQALVITFLIAIITTALMPDASDQWPAIAAFLPGYQTATISCYAVVAYLLYGYYRQTGQYALL